MACAVKIEEMRFLMDMVHPSNQYASTTSDMYDASSCLYRDAVITFKFDLVDKIQTMRSKMSGGA